MFTHNKTRRGTALVLTSIVILTIAGMAMVMTDLTINRYNQQKYRQSQVDLLAATESAANESINWLKNNDTVQEAMRNMTVSERGYPSATQSTSAVLVSSSLPSGLPQVFPALAEKYAKSSGGTIKINDGYAANTLNRRNNCIVETKVIKVQSDAIPSLWNGTERFIIYTTAMYGDPKYPDSVRRQRVEAVITILPVTSSEKVATTKDVPTPAFPFTRGLFSKNGFDVKGTAETDSWRSDKDFDGIADTPYVKPASYTVGGPNSNGDLGSNGVLGAGAYDTSKIHGTATPNAGAQIPNVIYQPPTDPTKYTKLATLTGDQTIIGKSLETTVYRTDSIAQKNGDTLTIDGSGTVVLYVDGTFDVGDINFAAGSTANLIIYQNDVAGKGASFNSKNTIGDPRDPKRFMFLSAFSGTGSKGLTLNGGAAFSAVVLAPNAGIKFNGNSHFYGSFVAADFSGAVNGTFNFHYDESLAGLSWGEVMKPVTTVVDVTKYLPPVLAPTAWNVTSVGYNAP